MSDPENTGGKQARRHNGQYERGTSGNPNGRPSGSRNRASLAAEAILTNEAEALTRKAVELAMSGDLVALRLCMERILPPVKERPLIVNLPLEQTADADAAMRAIVDALRAGELTASEMAALSKLVEAFVAQVRATDCLRPSELSGLFHSSF